ncbi:helix-turn-helix domain-containing protein [Clostridium tagluense]|uniref:helix-turn-helix domain-containing protein n=1 Tax=Clostridium tagluense TaxID=360422 RepID=UPI001CF2A344|nr:helix-turn-helix domain-containing protein [Clostridium tagluense]MCB2313635.1 helix-turn-helix domain-containing protein [Clostridium tagluense]MCB2318463.1 helix-turn-helix domain-containing protein [Clostridium tagluense]MCB2323301.1 helix-turn-helix domain-containing protein [Clostridium tagluense]MCB2328244.1 helix-turn-helix domain-containing protein [Clostridium tagluense]MCB2333003.1 helix-turn-helix domain-containing protein [Clostridium tagluense]
MENVSAIEEILTVEATAKYLKICRVNAYNLFHSESFPCFRIGKSLRVCRTDLIYFVRNTLVQQIN